MTSDEMGEMLYSSAAVESCFVCEHLHLHLHVRCR